MFDPYKRARAKSAKKIRRATVSAMTDVWGSVFAPAKPAKRKSAKPAKRAPKAKAGSAKGANKASRAQSSAKARPPSTSRSNTTNPRGSVFRTMTHKSDFGTRSYKLYVPRAAKTGSDPLPLIVMLHGCGQSSQDFARGTGMNALAEEFGFLVCYPEQTRKAQPNRCWNWFRRADQARGAGEPALLASMTRQIMAEQNVDPAKVYVAGLSAGASAALMLATAYPDIFAAVGVHSGLPVGAAHDGASMARAMQAGAVGQRLTTPMPTIIFHGDADKVVNPRNGRFVSIRAVEPYDSLDRTVRAGRVAGGREYERTVHRVGRGRSYTEHWLVRGSGHAWSGGHAAGSYTDPTGPDASREMTRFFLRHRTTKKRRALAPE